MKKTRKNSNRNKKTKKNRYGGSHGKNYRLNVPFKVTFRQIKDLLDDLKEITSVNDIDSYEIKKTYFIQFKDDHQHYFHFRILGKIKENGINYLEVFPVIEKGKRYGFLTSEQYINIDQIEYAYADDYSNEFYKKSIKKISEDVYKKTKTNKDPIHLPAEIQDNIFSYLKK